MTHHPDRSGPHSIEREGDQGPWFRRIKGIYVAFTGLCAVVGLLCGFTGKVLADYVDTKLGIKMAIAADAQSETRDKMLRDYLAQFSIHLDEIKAADRAYRQQTTDLMQRQQFELDKHQGLLDAHVIAIGELSRDSTQLTRRVEKLETRRP